MANEDKNGSATPPTPDNAGGLDFASLDEQQHIDSGPRPMHVRHPRTGEPLYDDEAKTKPCIVKVLSVESREYRRKTHQHTMRAFSRSKMSADEFERSGMDLVVAKIAALENIRYNGKLLTNSVEDKRLWVMLSPDFIRQVDEFANEMDHFRGPGDGS